MRGIAALIVATLLLAGCATLDQAVNQARTLFEPAARTDAIEAAAFSRAADGAELAPYWAPYIVTPSKPKTRYRLAAVDGRTVLEARADKSASGLYRPLRIDPKSYPELEWRWKIEHLIPGADNRIAQREDSPVRLILAFNGDMQKLDFFERGRMRLAKALSGQEMPYATLMYVWSNEHPPGTVIHNPHTARVRMIVVQSGADSVGEWVTYRRDMAEDYRTAFGEEPAEVLAVGLMTDADNTRESARAWYGDITFRKPRSRAP
jgi:hypothetical protein